MKKYALISVYDKSGVVDLARRVSGLGYTILSTGGTSKLLRDAGVPVTAVSAYTGAPEICEGRVKTLHPKIHGGILARRDNANDMAELAREGIETIDLVVVNLYPFALHVENALKSSGDASCERNLQSAGESGKAHDLIELIDIGGPTMIRAAAKNSKYVLPLCDPRDYDSVLTELESGEVSPETRARLAARVYATMSEYDALVARYFALNGDLGKFFEPANYEGGCWERTLDLRYGENPHQQAGLYRRVKLAGLTEECPWIQLAGKELSYNNLLDSQAAIELLVDLISNERLLSTCAIIKHSNPCGVAYHSDLHTAFTKARDCDPVSAFGGIVAVSGVVDESLAKTILEGFVEVICAPNYTAEALAEFDRKKSVRLLKIDLSLLARRSQQKQINVRSFFGDLLMQTSDSELGEIDILNAPTTRKGSPDRLSDYRLGWIVSKHVKSNAIVIAKGGMAVGIGAGQMSRVDSARIAIERARAHGHDVSGAIAASDAFLPFPDALEVLNDAGVEGLVQPGGSIRDRDVIQIANERGMEMLFTGRRHFRH